MQTVIGMMSGTSMDGVDAAVLVTDGVTIAGTGPTLFRPYAEDEKALLRKALAEARAIADRTRAAAGAQGRPKRWSPRPMPRPSRGFAGSTGSPCN